MPYDNVDELVIFQHFVESGLALTASNYLQGFLSFYGVQIHHLNPNSIMHISIYVDFCETFLGIEPHFDLFQYFFHLKLQPSDSKVDVVGGAGMQFCQGKKSQYIPYELTDKVINSKEMWFYVKNDPSSLPRRTPSPLLRDLAGIPGVAM